MDLPILNKRWEFVYVKQSDLQPNERGTCDAPTCRKKQIRILEGMTIEQTVDTVIHEMLHAADWSRDEEFVDTWATQVARALQRLGLLTDDKPQDLPDA